MDAREIIAQSLFQRDILSIEACRRYADYILSDLRTAGYRILGPDELCPVTVERFRTEISRLYPHYQSNASTDAARRQMLEYFKDYADTLSPEAPQPEAKEARE